MCNYNRKIMSYPFTGLDYKQINEIGGRVRILSNDSGFELMYIVPYTEKDNSSKREESFVINDERIKYTLCFFKFLNDMCRYNSEVPTFKAIDRNLLSYNTYIDTILICINEVVSSSRNNGISIDFNEILYRFGKKYDSNDLFRLYDTLDEYNYLNDLFNFLVEDDFCISTKKLNNNGVCFEKTCDGFINNVVNDIVDSKDNASFFAISCVSMSSPRLTKKISSNRVI